MSYFGCKVGLQLLIEKNIAKFKTFSPCSVIYHWAWKECKATCKWCEANTSVKSLTSLYLPVSCLLPLKAVRLMTVCLTVLETICQADPLKGLHKTLSPESICLPGPPHIQGAWLTAQVLTAHWSVTKTEITALESKKQSSHLPVWITWERSHLVPLS